jgi:hypothetical protein
MSAQRWQPRLGIGPGKIRLNDANLLMLRNIVKALYPAYAPGFTAQAQRLHQTIAGEADWQQQDALKEAKKLTAMVEQQLRLFEKRRFTNNDLKAILNELVAEGIADSYSDYAGAEQAYMAIAGVASHLQKAGGFSVERARQINAVLGSMRTALASDEKYQPAAFKAELLKLRQLTGTPAANTPAARPAVKPS